MSIYTLDYEVHYESVRIIGNFKVDANLEAKQIGSFLLAWGKGYGDTFQVYVSDGNVNLVRFYVPKRFMCGLLKVKDSPLLVEYLWYAGYSGLVGRFVSMLRDNLKAAAAYMENRIGAIVMHKTLGTKPVCRNFEKIEEMDEQGDLEIPKGVVMLYRTAVGFGLRDNMIICDGFSTKRRGNIRFDRSFAENLYLILDPLISEEVLIWWCKLLNGVKGGIVDFSSFEEM
jgi:hypothetical protein